MPLRPVGLLDRMAHAARELVCVLLGHDLEILERRYAATRRNALLGALGRCRRCCVEIDWREPSAGPTHRPGGP